MPKYIKLLICILFIAWVGSKVSLGDIETLTKKVGFPQIPPYDDLDRYHGQDNQRLSEVNGLLIADFEEHHISYVPINRFPSYLRYAFIAIEDERFYQHGPVDYRGIIRAAATNLERGQVTAGGSTITQQLVKNMFLSQDRTFVRKLQEVYLSYQLEKKYSKDQIFEMYLNQIYFGGGMYGVDRAAHKLFGVSAQDVNLAQAAMLACIPKHPNKYWPLDNPEVATKRQRIVLDQMVALGYITLDEAEAAKKQVILESDH